LIRDKKIQEIQIQRQRIIGFSIIGGVIILLFVILNLVRTSRISKQQHLKLQEAYNEIQRQKDILEVQAGEIEIANTQLQEINTTLAYSNRELDEANEFKMRMLSIASHDLKNPLHLITMLSELLQDANISPAEVRGLAQKIYHTSFRMTELVRDLLDIAAQEMGKMSIHPEMINITEVVKVVLEQYQLDFENKKQQIVFWGSEQEFWLEGDENKLHQVVGNLVSNAIKYSPFGKTITIRLFEKQLAEIEGAEKKVVLQVKDEGPGLSPEDLEKAFTFFQRLSAKTTGGESSNGVGLALVKTIVTLHNGSVWCESELGKGATFIVELPSA
jgi:signal transduction histidine kinase